MSTTDKLAQALRDMCKHLVRVMETGRDAIIDLGGECDSVEVMERGDQYLAKAREALAEHDATPAGEVTADADNFIGDGNNGWKRIQPKPSLVGMMEHIEKHGMQNTHATNSEFWIRDSAALVQQVERLTAELTHDRRQWNLAVSDAVEAREKCETLSADNARLAKDAERYGTLRSSQVKQSQYSNFFQSVNDDCNPPYLELKHGADLDAAVDTATAQANKG